MQGLTPRSPHQPAAFLASCLLQTGPNTCGETQVLSLAPCSTPLPVRRTASMWSWPGGRSRQNGWESGDRAADRARNPPADQSLRFPGLQRGRNSRAGGRQPLSQQVCARISAPRGRPASCCCQPFLSAALPFASRSVQRMSHPGCLRGDRESRVALALGPWSPEGAQRAQPPRSSFAPGPELTASKERWQGQEGEMQREPCRRANGIFSSE